MNEIRFNSFEPKPSTDNAEDSPKNNVVSQKTSLYKTIRRFFKFLLLIAVVSVVVIGFIYVYENYLTGNNSDTYSAVFLSNGQVYFGKIKENNSKEIILDNVFYLQSNNQSAVSGQSIQGSQFTLVKLGNELHGPTDELFINKQNVLFYEYLRSDSQVVQSIKNYKL